MITASRFTDAWGEAYRRRANAYGHVMPKDEQRRMRYALARMYRSMEREDRQRVSAGKAPLWNTKAA
jgi:hypothetical protein